MVKAYEDLAERVRHSNPAPAGSGPSDAMWDAATLLEVIDRRGATRGDVLPVSGNGRRHSPHSDPGVEWRRQRWRGPAVAAGAAVVVLLIATATVLMVGREEPVDIGDTPPVTSATELPTTAATPATTAPPTTPTTPTTTTTTAPAGSFEIDVESVDEGGVVSGTFTASGPAVAAGILCPAGTMSQAVAEWDVETMVESWTEIFFCDDGSGELTVDVTGRFQYGEVYWFSGEWIAFEGTGAYEGLTGNATTTVRCVNPSAPECHEDHDGHLQLADPDTSIPQHRYEPQ